MPSFSKLDDDGLIHLAMDDPDDIQATNFIEKEIGENVKIYIAPHENILQCLEKLPWRRQRREVLQWC